MAGAVLGKRPDGPEAQVSDRRGLPDGSPLPPREIRTAIISGRPARIRTLSDKSRVCGATDWGAGRLRSLVRGQDTVAVRRACGGDRAVLRPG